jgi:sugar phosphate isomerase/epimerase
MKYVYFTKTLKALDLKGLIAFCKDAGLDGLDLAVRAGYPVNPDNAAKALPDAVKTLAGEGLIVGLVTADTGLNDPDSKAAKSLFEACAVANIPAIKIGYFPYKGNFDANFADARKKLGGFAKLSAGAKVRTCVHTHSGNYLPNNCATLRLLVQDLDAHHVGAFVDTGHTAVNGGPIRMELDLVQTHLSLLAIKDMVWEKGAKGWAYQVAPAGDGIVKWNEVSQAVKERKFNGTISLHGEYETKDQAERLQKAKAELAFLKKLLTA